MIIETIFCKGDVSAYYFQFTGKYAKICMDMNKYLSERLSKTINFEAEEED